MTSHVEERIRDQNLNSPPLTVNSPLCVQMLLWEHIAWMQTGNKNVTSPIEKRIRD